MFQSKEERLSALTKLIEKFSQNEEEYKKSNYKEAKLRTDFLNPFFKILDWDIENAEGKSEKYRDVIIEDRIEISGSRRAPDFCFRIGGQPKFYVEA
ncbi:MAG: hypothetical protein LBH29_00045, partial [Elusimicrobiota bacterium]|nr:hypothetical protein [Elusimicrobiota bacterium]